MILLLHENRADLFREGIFPERLTLPDPVAVVANRFVLVLQVESRHLLRVLRSVYRLWHHRRHFADVVDLPRQDQSMIELLPGVDLELRGNVRVTRRR